MGLAEHHYHMVVVPLSLGCVPSAVLVKEPDPLKIHTCATGVTVLFTSFMTRGPRKAVNLVYRWPFGKNTLGRRALP